MEWETIVCRARAIRDEFLKSYKCLNINRDTKPETINRHMNILLTQFEKLRVLLNTNYSRLTKAHQTAADSFYWDLREKLISVSYRKDFKIHIPQSIQEPIVFETLPETEQGRNSNMPQTVVEFLNTASRLIPDFDGNSENLQSFIDAINLVDSIKESHESIAVNLIKTKLKGTARNLIGSETTLEQIVNKLKASVKGESVDVINAKLLSTRQSGKNVNAYAKEMEELAKKLETAYIGDGLPHEIANKYATRSVVTAMTRNSSSDRVRLIMQSSSFNNMNEVLTKFISSCTEVYGQENSILSYGSGRRGGDNRNNNYNSNSNRGRYNDSKRGRNFYGRNRGGNYGPGSYNNGPNLNRNSGSYRGNRNSNNNYNNGRNRNINVTGEHTPENEIRPLNTQ